MDRLQAGDLKSYLALQTPVAMPNVQNVLRTDASELQILGESQGLGYDIYDDAELGDTLSEFGVDTGFARDN